jgi:hypothetical protein
VLRIESLKRSAFRNNRGESEERVSICWNEKSLLKMYLKMHLGGGQDLICSAIPRFFMGEGYKIPIFYFGQKHKGDFLDFLNLFGSWKRGTCTPCFPLRYDHA